MSRLTPMGSSLLLNNHKPDMLRTTVYLYITCVVYDVHCNFCIMFYFSYFTHYLISTLLAIVYHLHLCYVSLVCVREWKSKLCYKVLPAQR